MFTHWHGNLIAAQGRVEQAHQVSCTLFDRAGKRDIGS